ncbi:MAG: 4,5:9,10-diseco-3-hydroxy-5,9, 17-trioxoandrosta(10),2-diene-4-oate hydrolase [Pseudomonadota bacterium]|jgi:pimeloyl-ACP methyl ester carboxylesterase
MYPISRESTSTFVSVRHCRYHLRQWGSSDPKAPLLLLAHGWMDVGASWQFMVDQLDAGWLQARRVVALDWRGYGLTEAPEVDSYWFPDYLGDLDALIGQLSPDAPIDLVGHSMGGNVVMMYAGARPARIRRLVNLEGFGMAETRPEQAPQRLGQWLDELQKHHAGDNTLHSYPDAAAVAARLMKNNARLPQAQADWLAQHWARPGSDGRWRILGDAAHKIVNPYLYRVDEVLAVFRQITAPVLAVEASDDSLGQWWKGKYTLEQYHARLQAVPQVQIARIEDAGHMLHHDQPQALARLLQDFLSA